MEERQRKRQMLYGGRNKGWAVVCGAMMTMIEDGDWRFKPYTEGNIPKNGCHDGMV